MSRTILGIVRIAITPLLVLFSFVLSTCVVCAVEDDLSQLLDEAEQQARQVRDETSRYILVHNVALDRARSGQVQQAASLVRQLEPNFLTHHSTADQIYIDIARQIARTSNLKAALDASQQISLMAGGRDEAIYAVAEEFVKRGDVVAANTALEQVPAPSSILRKGQVVNGLAAIAASHGREADAQQFFERAERLSSDLSAKGGFQSADVELALSIAAQRGLCEDVAGADRMFAVIHSSISAVTNDEKKQQYLYLFAAAAAEAHNFSLAQRTFEDISETMRRIQAGGAIARAQLAIGQLDAAATTASAIPGLEERISVLIALAESEVKIDKTLAAKSLETATKYLANASDDYKPWGIANLASVEYKLGHQARAGVLWQKAIKLADRLTIHADREKPRLITYVARLQAEAGDEREALVTAKLVGNESVYFELAAAESASGRSESAVKWISKEKSHEIKANALLGVVYGIIEDRERQGAQIGMFKLSACK